MSKHIKRAALYVRENEDIGRDFQLITLMYFAESSGYEVSPENVYKDKGNKAAPIVRPELKRLLLDSTDHLFDVVFVTQPDRISCSLDTLSYVNDVLSRNEVRLVFQRKTVELLI